MRTIQSVIFLTLCLTFGSCDIPGTLISTSRIAPRTASCLNTYFPVCGDCKTLWKCENSSTPPTVNCKEAYPDKPHCVDGGCSATQSSECAAAVKFSCTDAGYFPNPLNCSRYHLCAAGAVDAAVATYECPPGFAYNPATTICKLRVSATDCSTVDCTADPTGYALYPGDNKFFASCRVDEEPYMLKCPTYNIYDHSSSKCVFQCPQEGRIADPLDTTKYYECYFDGSTYFSQNLKCVDTYQFEQETQQCKPIPVG